MHEERRDRGSVAAGVVSGALRYARSRGADADTLATAAGSSEHLLADPDARVPLASHLRLLRAAAAELRDPAFALHLGADVGMAEVSVLGLVMEASATMGEALVQLQRYGAWRRRPTRGAAGGPTFEVEHDGDRLLLVDRRPGGTEPELVEEAVARLVCGPRRFLAAPHVLAVDVPHARPGHGAEYERVLGCPVRFDTGRHRPAAAPAGGELAGRAAPALRVRCAAGAGGGAALDVVVQPGPRGRQVPGAGGGRAASGRPPGGSGRRRGGGAPAVQPVDTVPAAAGRRGRATGRCWTTCGGNSRRRTCRPVGCRWPRWPTWWVSPRRLRSRGRSAAGPGRHRAPTGPGPTGVSGHGTPRAGPGCPRERAWSSRR